MEVPAHITQTLEGLNLALDQGPHGRYWGAICLLRIKVVSLDPPHFAPEKEMPVISRFLVEA